LTIQSPDGLLVFLEVALLFFVTVLLVVAFLVGIVVAAFLFQSLQFSVIQNLKIGYQNIGGKTQRG
jgi:hypothetical protein